MKPRIFLRLVLLVGFLFTSVAVTNAQWCKKHFKFRHLGPDRVPVTTSDTGSWCPNGIGWIESVAVFEQNRDIMYAGSNSGGLYRTKDGGKHWEFVLETNPVTGVLDIVLDSEDPQRLWVATGTPVNEQVFSHGILYSENGGKTWTRTGLELKPGDHQLCWAIERSRNQPEVFVATTNKSAFVSTDECGTFTELGLGQYKKPLDLREVKFFNGGSGNVVISGNRLFLGNISGDSANDLTENLSFHSRLRKNASLPDRIAVDINPLTGSILVLYKYNYLNYVDVSYDNGKTFNNLFAGRIFSRVDRNHAEIAYDKTDTTRIYVGAVRMYRSDDHGKKFTLISRPLLGAADWMHDDIRKLIVLDDGTVLTGNDGGVSLSRDRGESWLDLTGEGLAITQIYGISCSSNNERELLIGCQDLGNFYFDGMNWTNLGTIYGDGGECLIGKERNYVMQNGHLRSSKNNIQRWDNVPMPFRPDRLDYPIMHGRSEAELLAADDHVWRMSGREWENLSADAGKHFTKIKAMSHVSQGLREVILMGKDQPTWSPGEGLKGRLFVGVKDDSLWQWEDITSRLGILAWRSVGDVLIDPDDPNNMWVSLYGYDDGPNREKVYFSNDGGVSWVNISEGLPNLNTYCMLYIPESSNGVLLGTDDGVYFRNDRRDTWLKLSGRMPNLMVRDMDVQVDHKKVYIATYGNGVWELKLRRFLRK